LLHLWQTRPFVGPLPLAGHLGIASVCSTRLKGLTRGYETLMCTNERVGLAFYGVLERVPHLLRQQLIRDCPWAQTDGEIVLSLLNYYLERDVSAKDAMTLTLARLPGYFAVMALFAEENVLMVARLGCPLAIGVDKNAIYLSSDTSALSKLFRRIVQIEEGCSTILQVS